MLVEAQVNGSRHFRVVSRSTFRIKGSSDAAVDQEQEYCQLLVCLLNQVFGFSEDRPLLM